MLWSKFDLVINLPNPRHCTRDTHSCYAILLLADTSLLPGAYKRKLQDLKCNAKSIQGRVRANQNKSSNLEIFARMRHEVIGFTVSVVHPDADTPPLLSQRIPPNPRLLRFPPLFIPTLPQSRSLIPNCLQPLRINILKRQIRTNIRVRKVDIALRIPHAQMRPGVFVQVGELEVFIPGRGDYFRVVV